MALVRPVFDYQACPSSVDVLFYCPLHLTFVLRTGFQGALKPPKVYISKRASLPLYFCTISAKLGLNFITYYSSVVAFIEGVKNIHFISRFPGRL